MNNADTITLENDFAIVKIKYSGAELCSFYDKINQREIIWDANPNYWKRHAPALFPTVGKLKNNEYFVGEKSFSLPQHGFARDMVFTLEKSDSNSCRFFLKSSDETLEKYPFQFKFITEYILEGKKLDIIYRVQNIDSKPILFSLGAHPAFFCPFIEGEKIDDYQLILECIESSSILLLSENGLISDNKMEFFTNDNTISLSEELFKNDALIFDDLKSKNLIFKSTKNPMELKVSWKNFPHLGIWKPLNAPFLCIEPWQGMADKENSTGKLEDKFGIITLPVNEEFNASYSVEF